MAYQAHRNNEEIDEQQLQDEINVQNNADTIRNAAKVAKNAGGWVGAVGKAVDTADKFSGGKSSEFLGKGLNQANKIAPGGKAVQGLTNKVAESGIGDKIGDVADAKSADKTKAASKVKEGTDKANALNKVKDTGKKAANSEEAKEKIAEGANAVTSLPQNDNNGEKKESNFEGAANVAFSGKTIAFIVGIPIVIVIIALMIPFTGIMIKMQPFLNAYNNMIGKFNEFTDSITKGNLTKKEKQYYDKLKEVQAKYSAKGLCIDINLITAALTVETDLNAVLDDQDTSADFGKMKKEVELLAAMQVTHKNYLLDETSSNYCRDGSEEKAVESGIYDSSNAEKIASHDVNNKFAQFFLKEVDEEQNYSYYYYYPDYEKDNDGNYKYDSNGNKVCSKAYAKKEVEAKNESQIAEVNIGDFDNHKETIFYWNLVNSFIPEFYKDKLPKILENDNDENKQKTIDERQREIEKIATSVYALYKTVGNGQNCNTSSLAFNSGTCPNGITVIGYGTMPLEDYVAGVVANEAYLNENIEALKAQAVAARTYALNATNYCQNSIGNSTASQTFTSTPGIKAIQAAKETAGQVLTYNGKIFSAQYDSYCYKDNDCPSSKIGSDGKYSVNYTKVPSNTTHTIVLEDASQYSRIVEGQGHARGMSQLVSYQLAKEGMNYIEILKYFYADGIEIIRPNAFGGWFQNDPAWNSIRLGNFAGTELGSIGCFVTSLSIMIARSGTETILGDAFNPGTFAQAIKDLKGFSSGGGFLSFDNMTKVAPSFKFVKRVTYTSLSDLANYVNQGYYIMLNIHHPGEHHVVVDSVDVSNNKIYMTDPGRFGTEVFSAFPTLKIDSFSLFQTG